MKYLKEKLQTALGTFGLVIGYALSCILFTLPLVYLDFNFIVDIILIFVMLSVPFIGQLCELVLWVWSFFIVINEPINVFTIIYYIGLAIYVFGTLVPTLLSFFYSFRNRD